MANAFLLGNYAQSTVALAIGSGDTSFVLGSSGIFISPASGPPQQQGVLRIDDTGNANWNQITGPFEICYFTVNTVGTNTISGLIRGQEGTSAKAFLAGATVSQIISQGALAAMMARLDTWASQNMTGPLVIPPSLGGTAGTTSYGSMPVKIAEQAFSGATSVTTAAFPTGFRNIRIQIINAKSALAGNSDDILIQLNGDATDANYEQGRLWWAGSTGNFSISAHRPFIGPFPGSNAAAKVVASGQIILYDYRNTSFDKRIEYIGGGTAGGASYGTPQATVTQGAWHPATPVAVTTLSLVSNGGGNISGTLIIWGEP